MYVCGAVKVVSFVSACPYEINRSPIGCADVHTFLELCNSNKQGEATHEGCDILAREESIQEEQRERYFYAKTYYYY